MYQFQIAHQNRTKTLISRAKPTLLPGKSMWPWVCFPGIRNSTKVVTPPLSRLHHYGSEISRCTRRQHQHRYLKATLTDETPAPASKNRAGTSIGIGRRGCCPEGLRPRRTDWTDARPSVLDPSQFLRLANRLVLANLRNAPGGEAERFVLCILMEDQPP